MVSEGENNCLTVVNVYSTVYDMLTNDESDAIPEPIDDEDDAIGGYDITNVLESMRAHDARPDDGRCADCLETIVKGCSTFVYGDRLCGDCGSDRKVRL